MPPRPPPLSAPPAPPQGPFGGGLARALARVLAALLAGLAALVGLGLVLAAFIAGAAALFAWLVWARWRGGPAPSFQRPRRRRPGGSDLADVVDVVVREVPREVSRAKAATRPGD